MIPAAESSRLGLQHAAATERGGRALLPEHEGLSVNGDHRLGQEELGKLPAARRQLIAFQQGQRGRNVRGAQVNVIPPPMTHRPGGQVGTNDLYRQHARRFKITGRGKLLAAVNLTMVNARQVDRGPRTPANPLSTLVMAVQAAHPDEFAGGLPLQVVTHRNRSRGDRARDHGSMPGHRERAVDRHPEESRILPDGNLLTQPLELLLEVVNSLAGRRRGSHDRRVFQERPPDQFANLVLDQADPGRLGQVGLGQDDQPSGEPKKPKDFQMLARLGHHRVIGRHDQHCQVEPRCARQHVADESFMPRHIDQGQAAALQSQRREPDVDRDPALFFRGQPIGVNTRQGADQGRLAMVNMPRRSQNQITLAACHCRSAKQWIGPVADEFSLAV